VKEEVSHRTSAASYPIRAPNFFSSSYAYGALWVSPFLRPFRGSSQPRPPALLEDGEVSFPPLPFEANSTPPSFIITIFPFFAVRRDFSYEICRRYLRLVGIASFPPNGTFPSLFSLQKMNFPFPAPLYGLRGRSLKAWDSTSFVSPYHAVP